MGVTGVADIILHELEHCCGAGDGPRDEAETIKDCIFKLFKKYHL
jgi:hypothetical protein